MSTHFLERSQGICKAPRNRDWIRFRVTNSFFGVSLDPRSWFSQFRSWWRKTRSTTTEVRFQERNKIEDLNPRGCTFVQVFAVLPSNRWWRQANKMLQNRVTQTARAVPIREIGQKMKGHFEWSDGPALQGVSACGLKETQQCVATMQGYFCSSLVLVYRFLVWAMGRRFRSLSVPMEWL